MLQTCGRRWQQSAKGQTFSARTSRYAAVFAKCRSAKNPAGGTSVWTCATNGNRGHQNSILRICDGQNDYSASGQDRFSGDGCRCGATGSRLNAPLAAAKILGKLCTHTADNEKNQISGSYYAQQARDNKHGSFSEGCGFPAPRGVGTRRKRNFSAQRNPAKRLFWKRATCPLATHRFPRVLLRSGTNLLQT